MSNDLISQFVLGIVFATLKNFCAGPWTLCFLIFACIVTILNAGLLYSGSAGTCRSCAHSIIKASTTTQSLLFFIYLLIFQIVACYWCKNRQDTPRGHSTLPWDRSEWYLLFRPYYSSTWTYSPRITCVFPASWTSSASREFPSCQSSHRSKGADLGCRFPCCTIVCHQVCCRCWISPPCLMSRLTDYYLNLKLKRKTTLAYAHLPTTFVFELYHFKACFCPIF